MKHGTSLFGISGRSGNGKDLVGDIIQYITTSYAQGKFDISESGYITWGMGSKFHTSFKIKKYADKLKEVICLLIGCTREQLEDRVFKETELGPDWWYWKDPETGVLVKAYNGIEEEGLKLYKHSPRTLMITLATECGRKMIHPNLWVVALFSDYKPYSKGKALDSSDFGFNAYYHKSCDNCGDKYVGFKRQLFCKSCIEDESVNFFPKWIITDVRFPENEGLAIKQRGGKNIGVKRKFSLRYPEYAHLENEKNPYSIPVELKDIDSDLYTKLTHDSEELMGDFEWCDYIIVNDGTLDELIHKVMDILKLENVINGINLC